MAYYIKSKNNFDMDVYSTEDLRWTDNFSQRKDERIDTNSFKSIRISFVR